jgi:hypothetical protein
MWLLFQSAIMIAVGWTGIYYEWTPNKVALGIVCVGAAWLATWIINKLIEFRLVGADRVSYAHATTYREI